MSSEDDDSSSPPLNNENNPLSTDIHNDSLPTLQPKNQSLNNQLNSFSTPKALDRRARASRALDLCKNLTEEDWYRLRGGRLTPPYPVNLVSNVQIIIPAFTKILIESFVHRLRLGEAEGGVEVARRSRFRRSNIPAINIQDYITRICRYVEVLEPNMLFSVLEYAHILDPPNNNGESLVIIDAFSVHRFVITAICLACKAMGDDYYSNAFMAKVGGISISELNALELELCFSLDWKLQCSSEALTRCWKWIQDSSNLS